MSNKEFSDEKLLELLLTNSETAVQLIFKKYYPFLTRLLNRILLNASTSEDIAQDVFFELWKKRDSLSIKSSLKAYLRRAAINKALNHVRDNKIKIDDKAEDLTWLKSKIEGSIEQLETKELKDLIHSTIDCLPDRCRQVFVLSRFEYMTYNEIAVQLGISTKTVENQISKALKILRNTLKPYLK